MKQLRKENQILAFFRAVLVCEVRVKWYQPGGQFFSTKAVEASFIEWAGLNFKKPDMRFVRRTLRHEWGFSPKRKFAHDLNIGAKQHIMCYDLSVDSVRSLYRRALEDPTWDFTTDEKKVFRLREEKSHAKRTTECFLKSSSTSKPISKTRSPTKMTW